MSPTKALANDQLRSTLFEDQLYMQAMESMAAQFPDDPEVQLFYALSLLGTKAGVRDSLTG